MPSQFLGSEAGQNVELGAGDFTVTVIPLPSVADDMAYLETAVDEEDVDVEYQGAEFSEACSQIGPGFGAGSFTATGNIAAGQSETCKIVNYFGISPPDDPDD